MKLFFIIIFLFIHIYNLNANEPKPNTFCSRNKPLTIIVSSYNNEEWCKKNLSVDFDPSYKNFTFIHDDEDQNRQTNYRYEPIDFNQEKNSVQNNNENEKTPPREIVLTMNFRLINSLNK
ncbi:MAG: hypothetical protein ACOYT8_04875 [Candidatus Dependentiae bacterium]